MDKIVMKSMRKLLIPIVSEADTQFCLKLGEELSKSYDVYYLPRDQNVYYKTRNVIKSNILDGHIGSSTKISLSDLCDIYNISSPRSMVFPQMVYEYNYPDPNYGYRSKIFSQDDYSPYISEMHHLVDYLHELFEQDRYIPVQNQGPEILRRCVECVSKHHSKESIWIGFSPIENKSGIFHDESAAWNKKKFTTSPESFSDEEAKNFIEDFKTEKRQIGITQTNSLLENIHNKLNRLVNEGASILPHIFEWSKKAVNKNTITRLSLDDSREFINDNKYIYFPIQHFRESRITVRGQPFYNQSWIIEYISRSVPEDHTLVVKEHPNHIGEIPRNSLKVINTHSNLVHPNLNSHKIIENSSGVVTINNTVGLESLLHQTPVLVLGSAVYSTQNCIYEAQSLRNIDKKLKIIVERGCIDDKGLIRFAKDILANSHPITWGDISSENLKQFRLVIEKILDQNEK